MQATHLPSVRHRGVRREMQLKHCLAERIEHGRASGQPCAGVALWMVRLLLLCEGSRAEAAGSPGAASTGALALEQRACWIWRRACALRDLVVASVGEPCAPGSLSSLSACCHLRAADRPSGHDVSSRQGMIARQQQTGVHAPTRRATSKTCPGPNVAARRVRPKTQTRSQLMGLVVATRWAQAPAAGGQPDDCMATMPNANPLQQTSRFPFALAPPSVPNTGGDVIENDEDSMSQSPNNHNLNYVALTHREKNLHDKTLRVRTLETNWFQY